ncbi:hypothetical protein [Nostoc sp. UHCC 0302]
MKLPWQQRILCSSVCGKIGNTGLPRLHENAPPSLQTACGELQRILPLLE